MQQIGILFPIANHHFAQHRHRVYTAGGGRSDSGHLVVPFFGQTYLSHHQIKIAPRTSCPLQALTTVNTNQDSDIRKDKYFEVEMKVHDTELDQYGVVNNTIYSSNIQNGHDELLERLGISVDSVISKGNAMAISELHLKYFAPLRNGDRFLVMVKLVQIKGVRIIMEHLIETLPDQKLVLEAKATAVCLDKDYRPTVSTELLKFFSSKYD